MTRNLFSKAESDYCWKRRKVRRDKLVRQVNFIFGTNRTPDTIGSHINRRMLKEQDKCLEKLARDAEENLWKTKPPKSSFTPVITTLQLISAMTRTGHSVQSLAKTTGMDEGYVRQMVTDTGTPDHHAEIIAGALGMKAAGGKK